MKDLKVSDLIAVGSAGTFVLTVIYAYGYSVALGVNLFFYFSVSDYLRFAIQWFPSFLAALILGVLTAKLFSRIERGATEEEIAARTRNPGFTRKFRRHGELASVLVIVFATLLHTFLFLFRHVIIIPKKDLYSLWGITSPLTWIALVSWYAKERKLVAHWTKGFLTLIFLFPAAALLTFFHGLRSGESETPLLIRAADVQLLLHESKTPLEGRVLFLLDDYIVFRQKQSDKVAVMRRADVATVLHPGKR